MRAWPLFIALLSCPVLSQAEAVVDFLQIGFIENQGQYPADILFSRGERAIKRTSVDLSTSVSVSFVGSNPNTQVVGIDSLPAIVHSYEGEDPKAWRENLRHFRTVRHVSLYPGIDLEWNFGPDTPMLRMVAAPGADMAQVRLWFNGYVNAFTNSGAWIGSFDLNKPSATQSVGGENRVVSVGFVRTDDNTLEILPGTYDPSLPLVIEIGTSLGPQYPGVSRAVRAPNGGYFITDRLLDRVPWVHYLAKISSDGAVRALTLLSVAANAPRLAAKRDGGLLVAIDRSALRPTTATSPNPNRPNNDSGWIGVFDSSLKLKEATFTEGTITGIAATRDGEVYHATSQAIAKWVPGESRFRFVVRSIPNVTSIDVNNNGQVGFAAVRAPGLPTTAGAYQTRSTGIHDVYAGVLDAETGNLRWATYAAINGAPLESRFETSQVALAPGGALWISSGFSFEGASASTHIALAPNGTRLIWQERRGAQVDFDSNGNALLLVTEIPNLPTFPDAPLRSGCYGGTHLRRVSPDGRLLQATSLDPRKDPAVSGSFEPSTFINIAKHQYWLPYSIWPLDLNPSREPSITCIVHTARRTEGFSISPGGLYTIVGTQIGPVEDTYAPLEGALELAGVRVLMNNVAVPVISAQQGLVTFFLPENTPPGTDVIEVWRNGSFVARTTAWIELRGDFALVAADGSGKGAAAAFNEDGSVNSRSRPAKGGSVVTVYGTGPFPLPLRLFVGGTATALYAGPAPGLYPGVKQLNIRLPSRPYADWVHVQVLPTSEPDVLIYIVP